MEKLIELLNERIEESGSSDERISHDDDCIWLHWRHGELSQHYSASVICSKHFGFIQRLVYNDKIDLEKVKDNSELYIKFSCNDSEKGAFSKIILMLLSIQDSPIDFLISILK